MTPSQYIPRLPNHRPGSSWLTVPEVAAELRVSRMTVYRLIKGGDLPSIRIGRNIRVPENALDTFVREAWNSGWEAEE